MTTQSFPERTQLAVVGAGFAGIGLALALRKKGRRDFVILEAEQEVGGTWRANRYPGCACDVPSHLYELREAPNPNWSQVFSPQPEIEDYLRRVVKDRELYPHLYLGSPVTEARWTESGWKLSVQGGRSLLAQHLVLATGPLRVPKFPSFPGHGQFQGHSMHTARWNDKVELAGKKVAVIGTGASAVQVIPELAEVCDLTVYQRTPPWVLPRRNRRVLPRTQAGYRRFPFLRSLRRRLVLLYTELVGSVLFGNWLLRKIAVRIGRQHLKKQIKEPTLRDELRPTYELGCKRILFSDEYYPAMAKPNVSLVPRAVQRITQHGVVDSEGVARSADVIIYATGFDVTSFTSPLEIYGKDGRTLGQTWDREGASAYLGMFVPGFPNMALVLGPNSGVGHSSVVLMAEAQIDYILRVFGELKDGQLEISRQAHDAFREEMQERLANTVWLNGGCRSWYLDDQGRNVTLWPGFVKEFRRRTAKPLWSHFSVSNRSRLG